MTSQRHGPVTAIFKIRIFSSSFLSSRGPSGSPTCLSHHDGLHERKNKSHVLSCFCLELSFLLLGFAYLWDIFNAGITKSPSAVLSADWDCQIHCINWPTLLLHHLHAIQCFKFMPGSSQVCLLQEYKINTIPAKITGTCNRYPTFPILHTRLDLAEFIYDFARFLFATVHPTGSENLSRNPIAWNGCKT